MTTRVIPGVPHHSEWFRPQAGEIVYSKDTGRKLGVVTSTERNICHFMQLNGKMNSYIWRFTQYKLSEGVGWCLHFESLNKLHYTWSNGLYRDTPTDIRG